MCFVSSGKPTYRISYSIASSPKTSAYYYVFSKHIFADRL